MDTLSKWRKTTQHLAPERHPDEFSKDYDLYPGFPLGPGKISLGYSSLANTLAAHPSIIMDGYGGVFWENLRSRLSQEFETAGIRAVWHAVSVALRSQAEIGSLVEPFLGGEDPLFGTRFTGELSDFFDPEALHSFEPDPQADINILYGCGAALSGWRGFLVYVDVPKNEIQFRSRAGSITNLGTNQPQDHKKMYKRFYFVDWVALNQHKAHLLPNIDLVVDEQRPDEPAWIFANDLRDGLTQMAHNYFRVRPWFEPGPWGGSWIKGHIPGLSPTPPNYAWSFELISPENGISFIDASNKAMLEVSFDFLMYQESQSVLGKCAGRFGYEFPIRYDFLDTFDGGNLSIQVHPRPEYIREQFGENFTQDEAYYILDAEPGAQVYLGFKQDIKPEEFRAELEKSFKYQTPLDIDCYVNHVDSHKHDLFLIPSGTIHGSGKGNLVLEISATPYIFTFKMYDWLRPDLEGKPRPLNIERAFDNLIFERRGKLVQQELVSQPEVVERGSDWQTVHLPTHREHFYDTVRFEFRSTIEAQTNHSCHVMMLVEGDSIRLETEGGLMHRFNYAETFVVPAAAGRYRLINETDGPVKVVATFIKPNVY